LKAGEMTITKQLRDRIIASGETHYAIGKGASVAPQVLDRFVSGERPFLRSDTMDRVAEYFGLELAEKKPGTAPKEAAKKPGTTGKQAKKKPATKRERAKKSAE